ncbi:MAG TPA: hypothetical protein V6C97_03350, partial [Oculatellaceae cyanobacterium]
NEREKAIAAKLIIQVAKEKKNAGCSKKQKEKKKCVEHTYEENMRNQNTQAIAFSLGWEQIEI